MRCVTCSGLVDTVNGVLSCHRCGPLPAPASESPVVVQSEDEIMAQLIAEEERTRAAMAETETAVLAGR